MHSDNEGCFLAPFFKLLGVLLAIWFIVSIIENEISPPDKKKNPLAGSEAEWQSLSTQEKARRIEREMRRQGAK